MNYKKALKDDITKHAKHQDQRVKELEQKLAELAARAPHERKASEHRAAEVNATLAAITSEGVSAELSEMLTSLDRTRQSFVEQLAKGESALQALEDKQNSVAEQIEILHGKEAALATAEEALVAYHAAKQKLSEEIEAERTVWEEQVREKREAQQKEDDERAARLQEEAQQDKNRRAVQEEQYAHEWKIRRRDDEDNWAGEKRNRERAMAEREAASAAECARGEAALEAVAEEFERLRLAEKEWPDRLASAIDTAQADAVALTTKECEHRFALEKQRLEGEIRSLSEVNEGLHMRMEAQEAEIAKLRNALAASQDKIVAVSRDAFSAVSGQGALAAVKEVATSTGQTGKSGR